jgi:hypothetical protein
MYNSPAERNFCDENKSAQKLAIMEDENRQNGR